jgi:hypothetical protein
MKLIPFLICCVAASLTACANPAAQKPAAPTVSTVPGPEHAEIMSWAGDWTVKLRMRMGPNEPWLESTGTATFTALLDGRYLAQKLSCTMKFGEVEVPYESLEIFGFNNGTKEYEAWWFDGMSTTAMYTNGKEVNGRIELHGLMKDAITPEGRLALFTHRSIDDNHFFGEGYDTIPPAGLIKVIELEYTRVLP